MTNTYHLHLSLPPFHNAITMSQNVDYRSIAAPLKVKRTAAIDPKVYLLYTWVIRVVLMATIETWRSKYNSLLGTLETP